MAAVTLDIEATRAISEAIEEARNVFQGGFKIVGGTLKLEYGDGDDMVLVTAEFKDNRVSLTLETP